MFRINNKMIYYLWLIHKVHYDANHEMSIS